MRRVAVLAAALVCTAVLPSRAADMSSVATLTKPVAGGTPWTRDDVAALRRDVDALLADAPAIRGAHVGLLAVETASGSVLYNRVGDDNFQPASTFKLLVGSAALAKLGTGFTFRTTVLTDGKMLVVRGGGDALLRAGDLDAAAASVAAAGITSVDGVAGDESYFDGQRYGLGWSWDDFPYYYAPMISALSLEDNVVHLHVAPGARAGDPAAVTFEPPAYPGAIQVRAVTGAADAKDTLDIDRTGAGIIVVSGTIPAGAKPDDIDAAVPSPVAYVRAVFTDALRRHGVAVKDVTPANARIAGAARTVWTHDSEPLPQLLADLWYPSDNLIAEVLLKALGVARSGTPGTHEHGIALETDFLKEAGVDPATVSISDGSGLSGYDRITPRALVQILQYDWNGPNRDVVLDALPVAGVRGTLKASYAGTPAEKRVFAKTGSVSHVSTLAGYLATQRHGAVTFAFQVDDWNGEAAALRDLRGRVLSRIIGG